METSFQPVAPQAIGVTTGTPAGAARYITNSGYDDSLGNMHTHVADPIKNVEDIYAVTDYLLSSNKLSRYRDNLLFIMGLNFGFRIGDLLSLKVGDIIDENGQYREKVSKLEEKTDRHKKRDGTYTKGKIRTVFLNDAVKEAFDLYRDDRIARDGSIDMASYIFGGIGNKSKNSGKPIDVSTAYRLMEEIATACDLKMENGKGTHLLRKTFAYHVIIGAEDRPRAIEFLQKFLNHSSPTVTLYYAGITDDEIRNTYQNLNLGYSRGIAQSVGFAHSSAC